MKITDLQIFPAGTDPSNWDSFTSVPIFFVIATSAAGATPLASTNSPDEYGDVLNLRPSDSRQIAWGIISSQYGPWTYVDPDHIIPDDLYVNAWAVSSGGSLSPIPQNLGFVIKMRQVKQSGSEGLLQQIKETIEEN
jgi:hypothetical protein